MTLQRSDNLITMKLEKKAKKQKLNRGKYFLIYLFLCFSGARLSEVLSINDEKILTEETMRLRQTYKRKRKSYERYSASKL